MKSEIRKDYIDERYVIIAPHRKNRPNTVERAEKVELRPDPHRVNPFAPGTIDALNQVITTIPSTKKTEPWLIKVIKNKYPAVSPDNAKAYGYQEVVVETADEIKEIEDLPTSQVEKLFEVYAERTKALSEDKKINYLLIYKNHGGRAGASLQHAHSQIFASSFVPPHITEKSERLKNYYQKNKRHAFLDIIKKEAGGPRCIAEDNYAILFCPWAPMHNYEAWLMPKRHIDNVTNLTGAERKSLATFLQLALHKIDELGLPYNYYFHQLVPDNNQHLYIKIKPRGSVWAGVEIGTGLIINPVSPEEAAKFYRGK